MEEKKSNQLQMIALVIMRMVIGWHFLYEGIAKLLKPNWSAAGYLMQSRGFLSGIFRWMADTDVVLHVVSQLNMWGLTAIGLGLILGCLTRIASVTGMALLLLFYLCNPLFVGLYYSIPMEGNYLIINKNLVEMAALFVVFVTYSHRYIGIDRILYKLLPDGSKVRQLF